MTHSATHTRTFLPLSVFAFVLITLSVVQLVPSKPILVAERFFSGGGWFQVVAVSLYGFLIASKMQDPRNAPHWRLVSWFTFSCVFFIQLILGVFVNETFLMSGKLHLPIPALIVAGPIYRGEISFMTILFVSTIILSGPAWCSHLCYFGALDGLASKGINAARENKPNFPLKWTVLAATILIALTLRFAGVSNLYSIIIAIAFGVGGVLVILFVSRRRNQMAHCVMYCPIGTVVSLLKRVNPFRMRIDHNCTSCMACSSSCKYYALTPEDIKRGRPGFTCTYCGDCISACSVSSIQYKFIGLSPSAARGLYLFLSISLHAIFLAIARI